MSKIFNYSEGAYKYLNHLDIRELLELRTNQSLFGHIKADRYFGSRKA